MSDGAQHLRDDVILRLIDGELSANDANRIHEHLLTCPLCRARQLAMENTSDALLGLYRSQFPKAIPNGMEARAHLQTRFVRSRGRNSWRRRFTDCFSFPAIASAALLILFMVLIAAGGKQAWKSRHVMIIARTDVIVPNRVLTPGAVRSVTLAEICSTTDSDLDPEVSSSTERTVLEEYGIHSRNNSRNYQIDYLVNPQLGGTSDIKNLWPELSSTSSKWNAHAKDQLERRLHQMVCAGTVDLAAAQREIATDWIAAYKRYVPNA